MRSLVVCMLLLLLFFFFKQKTAYEMRISDWSSDVCSSDLVAAALGGIHHRRFEIALDGIGQFDRRGRTDNLWVGVTPHAPLKVLHNKVDQALARVGIGPDKRPFLPHVTIARFGREFGSLEGFVSRSGGVRSPPLEVDRKSVVWGTSVAVRVDLGGRRI